jgi:IS30 family transposase
VWRTRSPLDAGTSLVSHRRLSAQIERKRGSNENTNRLLRQYLPRRLDFRTLTQGDLDAIAQELNERPRQTFGFKSPAQALAEVLR